MFKVTALSITFLLFTISSYAMDNVRISSLEWPPYSGEKLPSQGATSEVVRLVFDRIATNVSFDFYPWQRAVQSARLGQTDGYGPEYPLESDEFILSDPIGQGPLMFAEQSHQPIIWENLDELMNKRMGVVQGYVNTVDLDKRLADKSQVHEAAVDDITNLRKLAMNRLDIVVIDSNVFAYLMATDPKLQRNQPAIRLNPKLLEMKTLHIAFRKDRRELVDRFNAAMRSVDTNQIINDYLTLNGF